MEDEKIQDGSLMQLVEKVVADGLLQCDVCQQVKPKVMFYNEPHAKTKHKGTCKDCLREYKKRQAEKNSLKKSKLAKIEAEKKAENPLLVDGVQYADTDLTMYNYKEPLRKVTDGYGYMGTVTITRDGHYIQCHICGQLFRNLAGHIWVRHKIKATDYKAKFGLSPTTALVSEDERIRLKTATLEWLKTLTEEEKKEYKRKAKEAYFEKGYAKRLQKGQPLESLENKNKKGTCPDQLLAKIVEVANAIGHTPTKEEFINFLGTQRFKHLIYKVFGSWTVAVDMAGLRPTDCDKKPHRIYTDEELLEYLRNFAIQNKKIPTQSDFNRAILPGFNTYIRHFGSLDNARKEAGIYEILGIKKEVNV